jgi:hypothetical protein
MPRKDLQVSSLFSYVTEVLIGDDATWLELGKAREKVQLELWLTYLLDGQPYWAELVDECSTAVHRQCPGSLTMITRPTTKSRDKIEVRPRHGGNHPPVSHSRVLCIAEKKA